MVCEDARGSAFPSIDLVTAFARFAGVRALLAGALIGLGALLEGVGVLLLVPLIGVLIDEEGRNWMPFPAGQALSVRLALLIGLFGLLVTLRGVVVTARDAYLARLQQEFVDSVRLRLLRTIAAAPWRAVSKLRHARIAHALSLDMQQIGVAASFILQAGVAVMILAVNSLIAVVLSPVAALLALAMLATGAWSSRAYLRRARHLGGAVTESHVLMTDGAIRLLDGLKVATAQNRQRHFVEEYEMAAGTARRHRIAFIRQQTMVRNLWVALAGLAGALTVLVGVAWLHLGAPVLVALLLVLARMSGPAVLVQQAAQQVMHSLPAYASVRSLEDALSGESPDRASEPAPRVGGDGRPCSIELAGVTYRHGTADGQEGGGVEGVSVSIPAGEMVGVAGPSGSGKTTLVDLIAGILLPQSGGITIDGVPLDGSGLGRHRERIAYAGQDPVLFADTIRRNLAWAAPGASEDELWEALALVGADDQARRLGGLEAMLGERGASISAGERQRLALARAVLRRPGLLILDEATCSIDAPGERAIFARIRSRPPCPTVLIVSHREETLAQCDRVLRFAAGRLEKASMVASLLPRRAAAGSGR